MITGMYVHTHISRHCMYVSKCSLFVCILHHWLYNAQNPFWTITPDQRSL